MTRKKWASMTPDERRIRLAQLCGWKVMRHGPVMASGCYGCFGYPPGYYDWAGYSNCTVPDYENDLNAIHEAYISLDPLQQHSFKCHLGRMFEASSGQPGMLADDDCGYFDAQCATAAQRAEALALTLEPE